MHLLVDLGTHVLGGLGRNASPWVNSFSNLLVLQSSMSPHCTQPGSDELITSSSALMAPQTGAFLTLDLPVSQQHANPASDLNLEEPPLWSFSWFYAQNLLPRLQQKKILRKKGYHRVIACKPYTRGFSCQRRDGLAFKQNLSACCSSVEWNG